MKVHLLMGPPGCGKTRRAEGRARELGATLVYHLMHQWTDADELYVGVDVAAAVAGDVEHVRQEGVLARAARLSHGGPVVLVLDEVDKASERTEALLLDFLQSGRVPVRPGQHIQANLEAIEVWLTSNNARPLSDALLRRCRRHWMRPIPAEKVEEIVAAETGAPRHIVALLRRAAYAAAAAEGRDHVTVPEMRRLIEEAMSASSITDLQEAVAGNAARTEAGAQWALGPEGRAAVAPAWAEIRRGVRR